MGPEFQTQGSSFGPGPPPGSMGMPPGSMAMMGPPASMGPLGSMAMAGPPGAMGQQGVDVSFLGSLPVAGPPRTMLPPGSMAMAGGPPMGPPGSMAMPGTMAFGGPPDFMGPPGMPGSMAMPPSGPLGPPMGMPPPTSGGFQAGPAGQDYYTVVPGSMPPQGLDVPSQVPLPSGPMGVPAQAPVPYAVAAQQVGERLGVAMRRHNGLLRDLDALTNGEYNNEVRNLYSVSRKANLDDVDWRVPRLIYAKDPKYNQGLDPRFAFEVQQRKLTEGQVLEATMSQEAEAHWARTQEVPFEQAVVTVKKAIPFVEAVPQYKAEEDIWSRKLELRTLDEAMTGDVSKPLPRPAIFGEDYQNYRQGKYVKDDCPIA